MSSLRNFLLASLGSVACISSLNHLDVLAQGSTVSTETTIETRGVGFKGANVFSPKYKERIGNYAEQIEMGATKGWLTASEVEQFKTRLEGMKTQEASAAAKGWVKADVDAIDKVFTQFNMDLSSASNKPPASAAPTTPAASAAKPAGTVAGGDAKTTTKSTTAKKATAKVKTTAKKKPAAKAK